MRFQGLFAKCHCSSSQTVNVHDMDAQSLSSEVDKVFLTSFFACSDLWRSWGMHLPDSLCLSGPLRHWFWEKTLKQFLLQDVASFESFNRDRPVTQTPGLWGWSLFDSQGFILPVFSQTLCSGRACSLMSLGLFSSVIWWWILSGAYWRLFWAQWILLLGLFFKC